MVISCFWLEKHRSGDFWNFEGEVDARIASGKAHQDDRAVVRGRGLASRYKCLWHLQNVLPL